MSNGLPLSAATRFQLGVFTGGFVPTISNIADWALHWHSRAEVKYNLELAGFGETMTVEENPAPFVAGTQLYVWGYNQKAASLSEWILLTDPAWVMPSDDPFAFPEYLDLPDAGNVSLGSVDPVAKTITSAAVASGVTPAFLFSDWLSQKFFLVERTNPTIGGSHADPDTDGLANLYEYYSGTDPRVASANAQQIAMSVVKSGSNAVVRIPGIPSVKPIWTVQGSENLINWTSSTPDLSYDFATGSWIFSAPLQNRYFWRLVLSN